MKVYYRILVTLLLLNGVHLQGIFSWDWKDVVGLAKNPIDKTLTAIGNRECAHVKRLVGVEYEQISDGLLEPDLNRLTLKFISRNVKVSLNLNTAAEVLPTMEGIDPSAKLIIYFHGFLDDPTGFNFRRISNAFLKTGEYNIVGLDASSLIRFLYLRSTTCVRFIGERMGDVLVAMVAKGLNPSNIHLIGHSLGAHIAGFTGARAAARGARVGRVTGLDPAGPCFSDVGQLRLRRDHAAFVDVIHTDAGVYGIEDSIGHVDFYPSGGSSQPGCLTQTCSHLRVNELFAETVLNPEGFVGKECDSYTAFRINYCNNRTSVMGLGTPSTARGVYYLRTEGRAPYALCTKSLRDSNIWT